MNIIKVLSTMIVNNHNNSTKMDKRDRMDKNAMYNRVSATINLATKGEMIVYSEGDKMYISREGDANYKSILIFKHHVNGTELIDFFQGLKRSGNPNGHIAYYKHIKTAEIEADNKRKELAKQKLDIKVYEGCVSCGISSEPAIKVYDPSLSERVTNAGRNALKELMGKIQFV